MLKRLLTVACVTATAALPLAITSPALAGPQIPPVVGMLHSCEVGPNQTALALLKAGGGDPNTLAWGGTCPYVADGIQTLGHLYVNVSDGASISAVVTCTLGTANADASGDGSYDVPFTHTGACTLTAHGYGYSGASAN